MIYLCVCIISYFLLWRAVLYYAVCNFMFFMLVWSYARVIFTPAGGVPDEVCLSNRGVSYQIIMRTHTYAHTERDLVIIKP